MIRLSEILKKEEFVHKVKKENEINRAAEEDKKEESSYTLHQRGFFIKKTRAQGLLTTAFAEASRRSEETKTSGITILSKDEKDANEVYNRMLVFMRRLIHEYKNKTYFSIYKIGELVEELIDILSSKGCEDFLWLTLESTRKNYLYAHTVNTAILGVKFLIEENRKPEDILTFGTSIFLHDLGMVDYIDIANQPRRLERREFDSIKNHIYGTIDYVRNAENFSFNKKEEVIEIIYHHHMNIDGSGYPEKIDAEKINYFARVLRVADSYEAMTHLRSWREARSPAHAVEELARLKKTYYDLNVVKTFIDIFSMYPIGTIVRLNTQEVCRVCKTYKELPTRPVVEVLFDFENKKSTERKIIDLAATPMLSIVEVLEKLPS